MIACPLIARISCSPLHHHQANEIRAHKAMEKAGIGGRENVRPDSSFRRNTPQVEGLNPNDVQTRQTHHSIITFEITERCEHENIVFKLKAFGIRDSFDFER